MGQLLTSMWALYSEAVAQDAAKEVPPDQLDAMASHAKLQVRGRDLFSPCFAPSMWMGRGGSWGGGGVRGGGGVPGDCASDGNVLGVDAQLPRGSVVTPPCPRVCRAPRAPGSPA